MPKPMCFTKPKKMTLHLVFFPQNLVGTQQVSSTYIISLVLSGCDSGGRPFHPSVPSSIHPSSSSRKKEMTEEEEEEEKLL
jgi:hypothetical protein